MKHRIDPTIDCVFKALLGSRENLNLLRHFLHSVLRPENPLEDLEILNPYNEREFEGDKLTIVDVKARDAQQTLYQIEIQLALYRYLPERVLYTWSDLYQSQLHSGESFQQLRPVVSIWILTDSLLPDAPACHHRFALYDPSHARCLTDHLSIHLLELSKWDSPPVWDGENQWLYFLREAKHWVELPEPLKNIPEMRQAMKTLSRFSEKERDYHAYQARQNAIREEKTRQELLEEAFQQRDAERQQKEAALAENEMLRRLLKQAGIDPETLKGNQP